MRTTINIDEHVLARAKDEARARGLTLGEYVERRLGEPEAQKPDPELPTWDGELLIPLDRMSNAEIQDFLDEGVPLDKLR